LAKEKIPGTIYTLVLEQVDSGFQLSLLLRGKIESTTSIQELDPDVILQASLDLVTEFRIPINELVLGSLALKLTHHFKKRPRKTKSARPRKRKKLPQRPDASFVSSIQHGQEMKGIFDELSHRLQTTNSEPEKIGIKDISQTIGDPEIRTHESTGDFTISQLSTTKVGKDTQETGIADLVVDQSTDTINTIEKLHKLVDPLQSEIQNLSKRLALIETRMHDQEKMANLEDKINTIETVIESVKTLEESIIRMENQVAEKVDQAKTTTTRPAEQVAKETSSPGSDITQLPEEIESPLFVHSQGFQELVEFDKQLDKDSTVSKTLDVDRDIVPVGKVTIQAESKASYQSKAIEEPQQSINSCIPSVDKQSSFPNASEPLSLAALKRLNLAKSDDQQSSNQSPPRGTERKPVEPKKRKTHFKALLDIEERRTKN